MKILILEADPEEQKLISSLLQHCNLSYECNVAKAINAIGLSRIDFALIDADNESDLGKWEELTKFMDNLGINYSVFSSNGKVGNRNGQEIISIHDLPLAVFDEVAEVAEG